MVGYGLSVTARSKKYYSLSTFHREFRREKRSQTLQKKRAESSEQREMRGMELLLLLLLLLLLPVLLNCDVSNNVCNCKCTYYYMQDLLRYV